MIVLDWLNSIKRNPNFYREKLKLNLVEVSSFCPRYAGKCDRKSHTQSNQSYLLCSLQHTLDDVAQ